MANERDRGSRTRRLLIAHLAAFGLIAGAAPVASAVVVGSLSQLAAPNNCLEQDSSLFSLGSEGCGFTAARGLFGSDGIAVSPDGRNAYVAGGVSGTPQSNALVELRRDPVTGALSESACISQTAAECDFKANGLSESEDVLVSPDGTRVYVSSPSAGVDVFERDATGSLTLIQCFKRSSDSGDLSCAKVVPDLEGARGIALSPDDGFLYAAEQNGNAIAIFARTSLNKLEYKGCISESSGGPGCATTNAHGLGGVTALAVSPDGKRLYSVSYADNALVTFNRNATTGALEYESCESGSSGAAACAVTNAGGLGNAQGLALSADGSRIYVVTLEGALSTFASTASGTTELGCLSALGKEPTCTTAEASLSGGTGILLDPAAAAGGGALYTTSYFAKSLNAFSLEAGSGLPVPLPSGGACVEATGAGAGCPATGQGLNAADAIAASADGKNIYVASRGEDKVTCGGSTCTDTVAAVASFVRAPVPVPLPVPTPPLPPPAPVLSAVHESATIWREGHRLAQISRRHRRRRLPVGTTISFSLNTTATVTFGFSRQAAGRKQGHRCVTRSRRNAKHGRCVRSVAAGSFSFPAHVGTNKVVFEGQISRGKALKPGPYLLSIEALGAGGRALPAHLAFTIAK